MSSIFKPVRGTFINPMHPLVSGLKSAWVFNEGTGTRIVSHNNKYFEITNSPSWKVDGLNFNSLSSQYATYQDAAGLGTIFGNIDNTTMLVGIVPYRTGTERQIIFGDWDSSGGLESCILEIQASHSYRFYKEYSGGRILSTVGDAPTDFGKIIHLACVSEKIGSTIYCQLWHNGIAGTLGSGTGTWRNGSNLSIARAGAYNGLYFNGVIKYLYFFNRSFSSSEIKWITREPYCFYHHENFGDSFVFSIAGDITASAGKQDLTLSAQSATILYDTTIQAGKQDLALSINSSVQLFDYLVASEKQNLSIEFAEDNRFDESFTGANGSAPSSKWSESDSPGFISIQNNKLNFLHDASSGSTFTGYISNNGWDLSIPFNVEIDFDINSDKFENYISTVASLGFTLITNSGWIITLTVRCDSTYGRHYYCNVTGTGGLGPYVVVTSDDSGKLRINYDKTGKITAYYWNNSLTRWEWDGDLGGKVIGVGIVDSYIASFRLGATLPRLVNGDVNLDNFNCTAIPYQVNYDTTVAVNKQDLTLSIQAPTIRAYDIWADEYTINVGSLGSGSLGDTYAEDTAYLVINEVAGVYPTGGFSVDFIFKDIPPTISKLYVNLIGYYEGNPAHNVKVLAKNISSSNFVNLTAETTDIPSGSADSTYQWEISIADYVSATGRLEFRFLHTSNGSVNHYLRINKLFLSEISNVISYPEKQDLTLSVLAPIVLYDTTVSAGKQDLTLSISSATIVTGNDVTVAANKQDLTLSVNQSQQLFDYLQAVGKQDLTLTVQAAAASTESQTTVAAGKQDLTLSVQAPAIEANASHSASVQVITFSINASTEIIACLISQPKQDLTLSVQSAAAGAGTVIILGTPAELTLVQNDISFYITHLLSVATQTAAFSILPVVVSVAQVQGALVAEVLWFTASAEAKAYQPSCAVETQ